LGVVLVVVKMFDIPLLEPEFGISFFDDGSIRLLWFREP
jgi:hypothetical protein